MKMVFDAGKLGGFGALKTYRMVDGKRVDERDRGVFKNVIVNNALIWLKPPYWGSTKTLAPGSSIWVGSGANLPKYTDSTPQAYVRTNSSVSTTTESLGFSSEGFAYKIKMVGTFNPSGNSYNIAEIGLGTSSEIRTRTLVRDVGGQPVTLSIGGDEFLEVTYYFTYSFQMPSTCSVTITGHPTETSPISATLKGAISGSYNYTNSYYSLALWDGAVGYGIRVAATTSNAVARSIDASNNFILTMSASINPIASDRTFTGIGYHPDTKYSSGCSVDFGKTITLPANHELKITFAFSFSRDPEPTE